MTKQTSMTDVPMLTCWWCNEPADPSSADHVRVPLQKVTYYRKQHTTEKKEIMIPRCKSCKSTQGKQSHIENLFVVFSVIAGSLGCYIGYLIQEKVGWISWVLGIGIFVLFWVILGIRRGSKSTEDSKFATATGKSWTDFPPVKALMEKGWKLDGAVTD